MRSIICLSLLLMAGLAGCLSDGETQDTKEEASDKLVYEVPNDSHAAFGFMTYRGALNYDFWGKPASLELPETLTGMEHVTHAEGTTNGAGIAVFGNLAFVGRQSGGLDVVDISDPENAKVIGHSADTPVRDADTIAFPDGTLILITTAGGRQIYATDVTDPENPELIAEFTTQHGNHNIAVVPGTPIAYNSGGSGAVDIIDFSTPDEPEQVGTFSNGNGCHDITFYISNAEEKYRAYCAAYDDVEIWDITDPIAPSMLNEWKWPAAGQDDTGSAFIVTFNHLTMPNEDASVLILGDETFGGLPTGGCDANVDTPVAATSGPLGNLYFYDITDEMNPVLHGQISPTVTDMGGVGSCTAHFGRVIEGTDQLVMGFYAAGVNLVDYSDLDNPRFVDRWSGDGSIWDVWHYDGYLYTGDISRGMDVLKLI